MQVFEGCGKEQDEDHCFSKVAADHNKIQKEQYDSKIFKTVFGTKQPKDGQDTYNQKLIKRCLNEFFQTNIIKKAHQLAKSQDMNTQTEPTNIWRGIY